MGVFSEIDMEMKANNSPFSMDSSRPLTSVAERPTTPVIQAEVVPALCAESNVPDTANAVSAAFASEDKPAEVKPQGQQPAPAPTAPASQTDSTKDAEEDAKRKAHEAAEAQRKADWQAAKAAKKAAEKEQLARLSIMSDDEVMMASVKRVAADTEKLTRRNMKEFVSEHIQTKCLDDPDFARRTMHPRKSMIHCIWYINRKAKEYLLKEMELNGQKPEGNGIYGGDVPDDLCYQWAEDYYNDPDAEEDKVKEEKFVPKPYNGKPAPKKTTTPEKKVVAQQETVKKPEPTQKADSGQMMLDFGGLKESA